MYFLSQGMNSLYTITGMATVRYLSVVRLQRSWHTETNITFWSSRCIWVIWGVSLIFAAPPLVGLGQYVKDISQIR